MSNLALIHAIKELSLPEHIVRAVVADYLDFLQERQLSNFEKLDGRLRQEAQLHDKIYFEAQGSMLAATLMLTIEDGIDVDSILAEVYGRQSDTDLLDMRRELVSRAIQQAKEASSLAGIPLSLVKIRKEKFCELASC
jgi:hypothetical protein